MKMTAIEFAFVFQAMACAMINPNQWVKYADGDDSPNEARKRTKALYIVSDYHDINLTFCIQGDCHYCCYVDNKPQAQACACNASDDGPRICPMVA